jgi:hypothetical protein
MGRNDFELTVYSTSLAKLDSGAFQNWGAFRRRGSKGLSDMKKAFLLCPHSKSLATER